MKQLVSFWTLCLVSLNKALCLQSWLHYQVDFFFFFPMVSGWLIAAPGTQLFSFQSRKRQVSLAQYSLQKS